MPDSEHQNANRPPDMPARQSLRCRRPVAATWVSLRAGASLVFVSLVFVSLVLATAVQAQIHDPLDTHPPRWYLDHSDCDARILSHEHLIEGGIDGGGCETITLRAGHGTEAILVYPIEPARPIDDLTVNVSVMSARSGARVGVRVRYPYVRDPETGRPVAVIVYGSSYERAGAFDSIGVGLIERELRLKSIAVRRQHGVTAEMEDPYVDGVVINAYSGVGTTALRIDELRIDGLVPLGNDVVTGNRPAAIDTSRMLRVDPESLEADPGQRTTSYPGAFPRGRVTRILEHNGEPLSWVRSLGFDAVLIRGPLDAEILREAIRFRMKIYSPPPSAPDPTLEPLLDPVAAWYLGNGEALDSRHLEDTAATSNRLRNWPSRWQRPLVAAPAERWRGYAALVDAIIDDLPIRSRGVTAGEEVAQMRETALQVGDRVELAVGIDSMPSETMLRQAEAIADSIGAPRPSGFRWHSMWLQTMRSLESTPSAILFRSSRSLATGSEYATGRSMALSYVNRIVAMIAPWVAIAAPAPPPRLVGAPYRCGRLSDGTTDLLLLTSVAVRGTEVLAGDGEALEILLSPADAAKTVWRLTHFSAERLSSEVTATGTRIQVVSPDAAELIVISSDPAVGGQLSRSATRFARQAGLDRWQLTSDLVRRTQQQWNAVSAVEAGQRPDGGGLLAAAERTLVDAEPLYRAGDVDSSLRMARRADAWALRSSWQLAEQLMPHWPHPTSCPPMDCGAAEVQTFWLPLMEENGWGKNRLTTGSLDDREMLARWDFGKRMGERVESQVMFAPRGAFRGSGALRARVTSVTDGVLPGGYEGTAIQIRGPSVRVPAGTAVRMDVMVRTLGFGHPHQGVLVYDTIGGQELGLLIRGRADWTPVRLYRQSLADQEVQIMFELIGAGEATIDEVELRIWEPEETPLPLPLRPISVRSTP